jgi:hypothetical protein
MKIGANVRWTGGIALVALVAACGGGGGGGEHDAVAAPAASTGGASPGIAAPAADSAQADLQKYVGTWLACFPAPVGTGSFIQSLAMRVKDAQTLDVSLTNTSMSQPGCAGAVTRIDESHQFSTFVGTKVADGGTVDKITILYDTGQAFKQVMTVFDGSRLYLGAVDRGPLDAEGFPDTLSPSIRTKGSLNVTTALPTVGSDKYAGTWAACVPNGTNFVLQRAVVLPTGSGAYESITTATFYALPGCSGNVLLTPKPLTYSTTIVGTATVGGQAVDRVQTLLPDGSVTRQITMIGGDGRWYFGDLNGPTDADGYPTTFSSAPRART